MDKYEYKVRADEIKDLIAQGEYVQAAEIADTIDWRRVKSVMMLCTISDLYKINRRYEDARNMLLLAYERRPGGRTICYSLCELSIKMEDYVPAVNYYKEFVQVAPKDPGRYILQYKLYEAQDVSLEERIGVLEELKKRDYREKWAYELAYLYHRVGLGTRCVEECDELILWFGEGKYVIKAMELKMLHQSLTPSQQEKYDHRFDGAAQTYYEPQQEVSRQETSQDQYYETRQQAASQGQLYYEDQQTAPQDQFYYEDQQTAPQGQFYYEGQPGMSQEQSYYEGQPGMPQEQSYYEGQPGMPQEQSYYEGQPGMPQEQPYYEGQPYYAEQQGALQGQPGMSQEQSYYEGQQGVSQESSYFVSGQEMVPGYEMGDKPRIYETISGGASADSEVFGEQELYNRQGVPAETAQPVPAQTEELDIQVKPMDMGQYNTINLQAEIAAGLKEVLEEDQKAARGDEITRAIMAPMLETETESLDLPEIDEVDAEDLGPEAEVMEGSEVFFGETGEIGDLQSSTQASSDGEAGKVIVPEIGKATVYAGDISGKYSVGSMQKETANTPVEWETLKQSAEAETANTPVEWETLKQPAEAETANTPVESETLKQPAEAEMANTPVESETLKQPAEAEMANTPVESETLKQPAEAETANTPVESETLKQSAEVEQKLTEADPAEGQPETDATAEIVMAQIRRESRAEEQVLTAQPPREIAGVLSQESDGQISLVMPESEQIEKQITGQMNLEDVLKEWERMKQENAEKRKEEVRQHVLRHTGEMFTAFEASVRDGLLEQLEKDNAKAQESSEEPFVEEELAEDMATEDGAVEETIYEPSEEEPVEEYAEDNEDWDSLLREEPEEELETILKEAEQEVIFGDADAVEEIEEIEEIEETGETDGFEPEEAEEPAPGREEAEETSFEAEGAEDLEAEKEKPEKEKPEQSEPEGENRKNPEQAAKSEKTQKPDKPEKPEQKEEAEASTVEREKGKVRSLTREEKELYGPYIQSRASREQLVQAIDNISMAAYTGNIIITGEEGMDTVSLAKDMIREVQMTDSNFAGKVAKISGQALNKKDVEATINQLASGALIIQKASGMDPDTAKRLHKALQQESFGIIIILEDVKKAMNKFLEQYPKLAACFTARMDVESLSNGTLVAFGRKYAREREYSIDDMGILALHTRIDEMQTSDHVVTVLEVKELVDSAIKHANRKTLKHFFDILLARRYDEEDMIILTERDFA